MTIATGVETASVPDTSEVANQFRNHPKDAKKAWPTV
jgi:hypothetical protein